MYDPTVSTIQPSAAERNARRFWVSLIVAITALVGCAKEEVLEFEPNMLYAHALEIHLGYPMKQGLQETQDALQRFFGTPDDPRLPTFATQGKYAGLIDVQRLRAAVGKHPKVGVYQKHCATCHGIVGNGRGTTAALLDPYPRDFRAGKFKFKSTPRGTKPLRTDLEFVIRHGAAGTAMKSIPELSDADINVLVDYVIYLSWRGETERDLLLESEEITFEEGESLFNVQLEQSDPATFATQLQRVEDISRRIADHWLIAPTRVNAIVAAPQDIPVPDKIDDLLKQLTAESDSALQRSVERGKELFLSESAACAKCHGKTGHGDGLTQDYDDWTKEWTSRIGIDPSDEAAQIPLVARGALPPRKIIPRDFSLGLFRGGASPEQLYRRMAEGIDGTPMPATSVSPQDIWHLVNYVRSLVDVAGLETMTEVGTRKAGEK